MSRSKDPSGAENQPAQGTPTPQGQGKQGSGQSRGPRASWLEGPTSSLPPAGRWPGERIGLPESGVGAMAGYAPRIGALFVDWIGSYAVALLLNHWLHWSRTAFSWLPWLIFVAELTVFVALTGSSFGHTFFGLRVTRVNDQRKPNIFQAFMRALFVGIVIPAVVTDRDGRGLHDRAVNTVLVRARG